MCSGAANSELLYDRGNSSKFTTLVRELEPAGVLTESRSYNFDFTTEKAYESYSGMNVKLNYVIRVTITRNYNQNVVKEREFCVHNTQTEPDNTSIKMEVGIEDCLHIEFEYDKKRYHLNDVIMGKIYFLLVRIKIKHMELAIIRRETAGSGPSTYNESENITKFELMDGAPVKGECIPVRLFLRSLPLTPTYRSVNNTFSVKYYLNLVLVDEEDRRYFKQQEITLWRRDVSSRVRVQQLVVLRCKRTHCFSSVRLYVCMRAAACVKFTLSGSYFSRQRRSAHVSFLVFPPNCKQQTATDMR